MVISILITSFSFIIILRKLKKSENNLNNIKKEDSKLKQFKKFYVYKFKTNFYLFFIFIVFITNHIVIGLCFKIKNSNCFYDSYHLIMSSLLLYALGDTLLYLSHTKYENNQDKYSNLIIKIRDVFFKFIKFVVPFFLIIIAIVKVFKNCI